MKVEKINDIELSSSDIVRVTEMGNITEVRYISRINRKPTIQMLGDRKYIELSTGEIKECKEQTNKRIDRMNALQNSFRTLRNLINANVVNARNCQWITLTYAENMQDNERLYNDFEKFHKRYKYYMKKKGIDSFEYISVIEPQGRGAWHIHLLYIFGSKPPFVPNEELREIWGHGFVHIKSLDNIDNVGAYLTAYLGDLPLDDMLSMVAVENGLKKHSGDMSREEDNEIDDCNHIKIDENTGKKYIKGGRLYFYPANMNLFRCSRGVKRPDTIEMSYKSAKKKSWEQQKHFKRLLG